MEKMLLTRPNFVDEVTVLKKDKLLKTDVLYSIVKMTK